MWQTVVNRVKLTDVMCGTAVDITLNEIHLGNLSKTKLIEDEVVLLWHQKPNLKKDQPNIIITADGKKRDVLAWLYTYFPQYRPITSNTRVFELSEKELLTEGAESDRENLFRGVFVDLIVAEARGNYLMLNRSIPKAAIPYLATISLCMAKGSIRNLSIESLEKLFKNWLYSRMIVEQNLPFELYTELKIIWQLVYYLRAGFSYEETHFDISQCVFDACTYLKKGEDVPPNIWNQITGGNVEYYSPQERANIPREDRLKHITELLNSREISDIQNVHSKAFLYGYLINSIASGTLDHIELFFSVFKNTHNAHIWYALCSGLSRDSQTTKDLSALERRLYKELHVRWNPADPPSADLSLDEFEIANNEKELSLDVTTLLEGFIIVELWPGISTYIKLKKAIDSEQKELFEDTVKVRRKDITLIKSQIDGVMKSLKEIERSQDNIDNKATFHRRSKGGKYYNKQNRPNKQSKKP